MKSKWKEDIGMLMMVNYQYVQSRRKMFLGYIERVRALLLLLGYIDRIRAYIKKYKYLTDILINNSALVIVFINMQVPFS